MRACSRPGALTVLLALALSAAAGAQPLRPATDPAERHTLPSADLLAVIDSCIGRLHPDMDVGYERIAARCPDLTRRLTTSHWAAWLPRDWLRPGNDLSATGLRELRELLVLESGRRPDRVPSVAPVREILAGLGQGDEDGAGWWSRTRSWVRALSARDEAGKGWITHLIGQAGLSQVVIEVISYAALALVVVLATAIVINELLTAGVLRRLRGRVGAGRVRKPPPLDVTWGLRWEAVRAMAPLQRPRALLELIVERLTTEDRLPPARSMTVRELIREARLPDESDRERLSALARVSELVRYSADRVNEETLVGVVEGARALLDAEPHENRVTRVKTG